eukprot:1874875-Amphidinium_carterae.1
MTTNASHAMPLVFLDSTKSEDRQTVNKAAPPDAQSSRFASNTRQLGRQLTTSHHTVRHKPRLCGAFASRHLPFLLGCFRGLAIITTVDEHSKRFKGAKRIMQSHYKLKTQHGTACSRA